MPYFAVLILAEHGRRVPFLFKQNDPQSVLPEISGCGRTYIAPGELETQKMYSFWSFPVANGSHRAQDGRNFGKKNIFFEKK